MCMSFDFGDGCVAENILELKIILFDMGFCESDIPIDPYYKRSALDNPLNCLCPIDLVGLSKLLNKTVVSDFIYYYFCEEPTRKLDDINMYRVY